MQYAIIDYLGMRGFNIKSAGRTSTDKTARSVMSGNRTINYVFFADFRFLLGAHARQTECHPAIVAWEPGAVVSVGPGLGADRDVVRSGSLIPDWQGDSAPVWVLSWPVTQVSELRLTIYTVIQARTLQSKIFKCKVSQTTAPTSKVDRSRRNCANKAFKV